MPGAQITAARIPFSVVFTDAFLTTAAIALPRLLARTVRLERVIGCMINSANEVVEPGVIRNSPGTRIAYLGIEGPADAGPFGPLFR